MGNPSVGRFKAKYTFAVPKSRSLLQAIDDRGFLDNTQKGEVDRYLDWKRLKSLYPGRHGPFLHMSMRNKELRLCQVCDLHIDEMKVRAEHVKGEGTYGQAREGMPYRPEARRKTA